MPRSTRVRIPAAELAEYRAFYSEDVGGNAKLRCLVSDEAEPEPQCHHLFEDPGRSGAFFANLLPLGASFNAEVELSRRGPRGNAITSEKLALLAFQRYEDTRLPQSYGLARLGSYIASQREDNPDGGLRLAGYAIMGLRMVEQRWGVVLARDTLKRSVLPILADDQLLRRVRPESLFALVVGLGTFHRDYGDRLAAEDAFGLAFHLARTTGEAFLHSDAFVRLASHWRIHVSGFGAGGPADRMADYRRTRTRYRATSHQAANDDLWEIRPALDRMDPHEALDHVRRVETRLFRSGGFSRTPMDPRPGITVSRAMQRAFLEVLAQVELRRGHVGSAEELVGLSRIVARPARLGANVLAQPSVVQDVVLAHPGDLKFDIELRSAEALRSLGATQPSESFSELSRVTRDRVRGRLLVVRALVPPV